MQRKRLLKKQIKQKKRKGNIQKRPKKTNTNPKLNNTIPNLNNTNHNTINVNFQKPPKAARRKQSKSNNQKVAEALPIPNHNHISYITEHSNNSDNQFIQNLIKENEKSNSLFNEFKSHSLAQSEEILRKLNKKSFVYKHPNEEFRKTLETDSLLNRETFHSSANPFDGYYPDPPDSFITPNYRSENESKASTPPKNLKDNTQQNSFSLNTLSNNTLSKPTASNSFFSPSNLNVFRSLRRSNRKVIPIQENQDSEEELTKAQRQTQKARETKARNLAENKRKKKEDQIS